MRIDRIQSINLAKPLISERDKTATERRSFPSEARERLTTYRSRLTVVIEFVLEDEDGSRKAYQETRDCGLLPVMVRVSDNFLSDGNEQSEGLSFSLIAVTCKISRQQP